VVDDETHRYVASRVMPVAFAGARNDDSTLPLVLMR